MYRRWSLSKYHSTGGIGKHWTLTAAWQIIFLHWTLDEGLLRQWNRMSMMLYKEEFLCVRVLSVSMPWQWHGKNTQKNQKHRQCITVAALLKWWLRFSGCSWSYSVELVEVLNRMWKLVGSKLVTKLFFLATKSSTFVRVLPFHFLICFLIFLIYVSHTSLHVS